MNKLYCIISGKYCLNLDTNFVWCCGSTSTDSYEDLMVDNENNF